METKIKNLLARLAFFAEDGMAEPPIVAMAKDADALLKEMCRGFAEKAQQDTAQDCTFTNCGPAYVVGVGEVTAQQAEPVAWHTNDTRVSSEHIDALKLLQYMVDHMSDYGDGSLLINGMDGKEVVAEWLPAARAILAAAPQAATEGCGACGDGCKGQGCRLERESPPTCQTCNGHGMIGGLLPNGGGYDGQPCPDCAAQKGGA